MEPSHIQEKENRRRARQGQKIINFARTVFGDHESDDDTIVQDILSDLIHWKCEVFTQRKKNNLRLFTDIYETACDHTSIERGFEPEFGRVLAENFVDLGIFTEGSKP